MKSIACHKTVYKGGFMTYIIDNAHILKEETVQNSSILMENGMISSVRPSFKLYKHMRMDADSFLMTPTHILFDPSLPLKASKSEKKNYFLNQFLLKGCTVIFTSVTIRYEQELKPELKRLHSEMADSPLDYVVGVRIPVQLLTPSLIRACKKEKIPVIMLEITDFSELRDRPWGWIKEAMFPYNSPLAPVFCSEATGRSDEAAADWIKLMTSMKIPHLRSELCEGDPLKMEVLKKTGIFPFKSNLYNGGEISYNFYSRSPEVENVEISQLFHYHNDRLLITVHKGIVVRAGSQVFYHEGAGENVKIKTPAFFQASY